MTTKKPNLLKLFAVILLIAGIASTGYFIYSRISAAQTSTTDSTALQMAKATVGDLALYANGTGTVIPAAESSLGFNSSGQVKEIYVKVGESVKTGDVLAQIGDTRAAMELAEAQEAMNKLTSAASIATAKQALADAQTDFAAKKKSLEYLISPEVLYWEEKVTERTQTLSDAQSATQSDTSATAKQKVSEAETSLQYAQDSLKYFQNVYTETYVPETFTQYRTMRSPRGTVTEVVKVEDPDTGEMVDLIYAPTEGEIAMARADYDLAKATIAEAQIYLDALNGEEIPEGATGSKLVTYLQTKHALETAQYNLNATKLMALFDGTVTALDMNVGDLASGSPVITVSNLEQPYSLEAYLDAEDWGMVKTGYEVEVVFDILPDQVFKGTVTNVFPTLDTTSSNTALVHITARLNDAIAYQLPAGSAASVDVVGGRTENAVLVPVEALHEIEDGRYTLFVLKNGTLRLRLVEVGLQDLTKAEILSGVSAGDVVSTGVIETK